MLIDLVPNDLHEQFKSFQRKLSRLPQKKIAICPFCRSKKLCVARSKTLTYHCKNCNKYCNPLTNTLFNRQQPANWFNKILTRRIEKASYFIIAEEFDSTPQKIKRRNQSIMEDMRLCYPELAQWYINHQQLQNDNNLTDALKQQHQALNVKITQLLTISNANCPSCESNKTIKISHRTGFRCENCHNTFNLLSNTILNRMPYSDRWLMFIDLLVAGKNNEQIASQINLSHSTITRWRRCWCQMMKKWGFNALAIWCS